MNKFIVLFVLLTFLSCKNEPESADYINLKLTEVNGFGPFGKSFNSLIWSPISENKAWKNTEIKTIGLPGNWTKSNINQVWFDSHQFAYQNYKLGNLTKDYFNTLVENWEIDLKKRKLSDNPINCFVHIAIGENEKQELEYIIDTNNNNDFSDEKTQKPTLIESGLDYENLIEKSQTVIAEISTNNGIKKKEIKILVLSDSNGGLLYSFPHFAKTNYLENEIFVSNGFSNITYEEETSIILNKSKTEVIGLNEFIEIENSFYKNLGVDMNSNELQLLKMPKDTILYSTRVGFNAKPFSVKQLEVNDSLKLGDFKDRFLYLEFWGSWCAPCIEEIPNLKKAYDMTNRNDVEFLGVAVFDTKETLKKTITKYHINWPQVLNSDANKFKENYNVIGYPTSFLIDKKGKIIAKNLRGEKLLDTLNYYLKQTELNTK